MVDFQVAFNNKSSNLKSKGDSCSKNVKNDRPACIHYGLVGHISDRYYKIHGYPCRNPKGRSNNFDPLASTNVNQVFDITSKPSRFILPSFISSIAVCTQSIRPPTPIRPYRPPGCARIVQDMMKQL